MSVLAVQNPVPRIEGVTSKGTTVYSTHAHEFSIFRPPPSKLEGFHEGRDYFNSEKRVKEPKAS